MSLVLGLHTPIQVVIFVVFLPIRSLFGRHLSRSSLVGVKPQSSQGTYTRNLYRRVEPVVGICMGGCSTGYWGGRSPCLVGNLLGSRWERFLVAERGTERAITPLGGELGWLRLGGGSTRYWEGNRTAWWGTLGDPLRTLSGGRSRYWEGYRTAWWRAWMTPTGVGYGDSAGRERRGLSTPGELRVYGGSYTLDILEVYSVSTLRMFSESMGFLHSGCSRSLRGFYTLDILGDYGDSILRIFSESTRFLHSGCSRSLRGYILWPMSSLRDLSLRERSCVWACGALVELTLKKPKKYTPQSIVVLILHF